MGRSKINPFLEQGVFDDDEKEEEKSELLTSMNVDEENSEGPTWLNVRQVQLPSSGKIIPVVGSREIEGGTGNSEADKWKCIRALGRIREVLEPIYL